MAGIKEIYLELSEQCKSICEQSIKEETATIISGNHAWIEDYSMWASILAERPEHLMFKSALREYQLSILANSLGLYSLSFTGLRFFFERTLTAILFSGKETDLRLWIKGQRDIYWNDLVHDDTGLFSHTFYNAFFPELKDDVKHYQSIAKKVYRECSEYVHGNAAAHYRIPDKLEYAEPLVDEWHNKADTIKDVIIFAFCLRYLPYLNNEQKAKVEEIILDNLSHIEAIRLLLQKPN